MGDKKAETVDHKKDKRSSSVGKDKASVTLQHLAGGTIEDPKAMKIHSRSPKYSFWTIAVDRNTRAVDVITSIGAKIKTSVDDLVLYEVGELDGLVTGAKNYLKMLKYYRISFSILNLQRKDYRMTR